jgi:hypothetical protein
MTAANYHIRNRHLPQGKFEGGIDEMNRILDSTDPVAVEDAGVAYEAAAKKFGDTLGVLRQEVRNLVEHWGGPAAEQAVQQMELLYTSTRELSLCSSETGSGLINHSTRLEWYKRYQPDKGFIPDVSRGDIEAGGTVAAVTMNPMAGLAAGTAHHFMGGNSEDKAAQEHMARLAGRTVEANDAVPESLSIDFPQFRDKQRPPPPSSVRERDLDFSGGTAHDPVGMGTSDPFAPSKPDPFTGGTNDLGSGGTGNGTDGAGNPGGGDSSDLVGSGGSGGGTDLAGLGGGVPGGIGGGGGLGGGIGAGDGMGGAPNAVGMGVGLPPGGGRGRGLSGSGRGGGKAGSGQPDVGDPPAGGEGDGDDEEERERTTWLTEDDDVWGGADGNVSPSVIG